MGAPRESCPHCVNQYRAPGYCGLTQDGSKEYTVPLDSRGAPIESPPLQATLTAGEPTTIGFKLTAHHKGHVELGVCCDAQPSQACFDRNPLTFQQDLLYGAPVDAAHPERGYVAPRAMGNPNIGDGQSPGGMGTGEYGNAMDFRMKFRLPAGVSGDRCLIQWRYITGNSCEMPGYDQVAWPNQAWRNAGVGTCALPLSAEGRGRRSASGTARTSRCSPPGAGPHRGRTPRRWAPGPPAGVRARRAAARMRPVSPAPPAAAGATCATAKASGTGSASLARAALRRPRLHPRLHPRRHPHLWFRRRCRPFRLLRPLLRAARRPGPHAAVSALPAAKGTTTASRAAPTAARASAARARASGTGSAPRAPALRQDARLPCRSPAAGRPQASSASTRRGVPAPTWGRRRARRRRGVPAPTWGR